MRLLLVEDDKMIGEGLQKTLRGSYNVNWVRSAEEASEALTTGEYNLILLDIGLPGQSGLSLLSGLRKRENAIPVLMLTARDTVKDRITGLDAGADDYLVKPFDLDELQARIRALLRRKDTLADTVLQHNGISLNPATHELCCGGKKDVLSARQLRLMQALLEKPGTIFSRAQLEEKIYGWNEEVESNSVEVHIHVLRRKFGTQVIRNVRGVGYTIGSA
jgi:DNA-binding response OmpR family regulator